MIAPHHNRPANTNIDQKEYDQLKEIVWNFKHPYKLHGLRNNRPLYKIIRTLEQKNLIKRKGYYFNPTKYGWLAYLNFNKHKTNQKEEKPHEQNKLT